MSTCKTCGQQIPLGFEHRCTTPTVDTADMITKLESIDGCFPCNGCETCKFDMLTKSQNIDISKPSVDGAKVSDTEMITTDLRALIPILAQIEHCHSKSMLIGRVISKIGQQAITIKELESKVEEWQRDAFNRRIEVEDLKAFTNTQSKEIQRLTSENNTLQIATDLVSKDLNMYRNMTVQEFEKLQSQKG